MTALNPGGLEDKFNGLTRQKWIMSVTWSLLFLSLFCSSTQDGNDQENGSPEVDCGPQNVTVRSCGPTMQLTWEDKPRCSAVQDVLVYELLVLIADAQVHYEEVTVPPEQIGSTHSWIWTSEALEGGSPSVRLRSRHKNHPSLQNQEQTLPGRTASTKPEVFPKDRNFQVGSRVTFCCIVPAGQVFNRMYLTGYNSGNTTKISAEMFALTVLLTRPSTGSCTNVNCKTKTNQHGAACVYIGYPPDYRDLQCETQDLESVDCHWTVVRDTHLPVKKPPVYQILGSLCEKQSDARCSQKVQVAVGERNWTFTAQNQYGKVELSDTADLTKRVHMFAPKGVRASTDATNVSLEWTWTVPQYNNLNITCQVNIGHGESTIREKSGVGLNSAVLNDLIPNWTYNVTVRCGTAQHFWQWSDWSTSVTFHTKGDVPDALDVWMQRKDKSSTIIWKTLLANQSHGHILDYEVTWTKTTDREALNRIRVSNHSLALKLDTTDEYIVTVTARNINGSSSPSTITIPRLGPDSARVNTSLVTGSDDSFQICWSASPAASCGYIVDWCPALGNCTAEWLKVPPHQTHAQIVSKNFRHGLRYLLSVYACTQGAPVLLQTREGYVRQESIQDGLFKSLNWKPQGSNFEVSWEPIPLREQTAFIQGYVLYCSDNNNKVINFSTDDPTATSLTATNLQISTYEFTVKARTAVGECGAASITATLNPPTDDLIKAVIISLLAVSGLLSLITVLCYRQWTCIKREICPPIPKPVLTSPGECHWRPLYVDQCLYSEADIVDVPQLLCGAGAPTCGSIGQDKMPFGFTQTPKGYSNQPLKKCTVTPLTLFTVAPPRQPGLPSSPFRSEFPNPSYNLTPQRSSSGPEHRGGPDLERSSDGYQPHTEVLTTNQTQEDQDSPMFCVTTYVLLPQLPST